MLSFFCSSIYFCPHPTRSKKISTHGHSVILISASLLRKRCLLHFFIIAGLNFLSLKFPLLVISHLLIRIAYRVLVIEYKSNENVKNQSVNSKIAYQDLKSIYEA